MSCEFHSLDVEDSNRPTGMPLHHTFSSYARLFFPPFFISFILNKKIGVGQPKVVENAKILIANTAMDTDKIKIYGSRVRVDSMNKARSWGIDDLSEAILDRCQLAFNPT